MTDIVKTQAQEPSTRLAIIEHRIREHMNNATGHLLGVGQCLNEAKAGGLVPHGEWEAWVLRNTGFSVRQAQRLMSAAREVPEGSVLAQLSFSKIQACLQLPSGERETMAQRAQDESMSLRELQKAVDAEKKRADDANGALQRAWQEAKKQEELKKAAQRTADEALAKVGALRVELADTKTRVREAQQATTQGVSAEAQAEIERLRAELADAEAMAEHQAEKRQEAQQELLNYKAQAARGERLATDEGLTLPQLATAVQMFVGSCGALPHMGDTLATMPTANKSQMAAYVEMMGEWVEGARRALSMVYIEGEG